MPFPESIQFPQVHAAVHGRTARGRRRAPGPPTRSRSRSLRLRAEPRSALPASTLARSRGPAAPAGGS